jgi:hypothetical protein
MDIITLEFRHRSSIIFAKNGEGLSILCPLEPDSQELEVLADLCQAYATGGWDSLVSWMAICASQKPFLLKPPSPEEIESEDLLTKGRYPNCTLFRSQPMDPRLAEMLLNPKLSKAVAALSHARGPGEGSKNFWFFHGWLPIQISVDWPHIKLDGGCWLHTESPHYTAASILTRQGYSVTKIIQRVEKEIALLQKRNAARQLRILEELKALSLL